MNTMNTARRAQVIRCLIEGCSINSAVRMTGAAKHTVLKLLVELGEAFMEFLNETMVNLHCERIQVDEIWRFVGCKQKNVTEKKIERDRICGDVWTWTAIDAESAGFNDKSWLDMVGHPHSERLHVTEKFRRTDFGHMQVDVTYEDPETLTRPLTMSVNADHVR